MLAEVVVVWFGLLLLIGFVGFFIVLVSLLARGIRALGRALLPGSSDAGPSVGPANGRPLQACSNGRCGYLNPPVARYCARCGSPLDGVAER